MCERRARCTRLIASDHMRKAVPISPRDQCAVERRSAARRPATTPFQPSNAVAVC